MPPRALADEVDAGSSKESASRQEPSGASRPSRVGRGSGPLLRALLLVLLAASIPLKLWMLPDARAAGQAGDDAVRDGLRTFLAEAGFSAQIEGGMVGMPAASGTRDGCRVLLASVAPQGYHRDLIFRLAAPGDAVSFLFRGRAYPDQPGWATWAARLLSHLRLAPAGTGSERVFAVLAAGACGIEAPAWAERLGQRGW